jgi:hypothetical protein
MSRRLDGVLTSFPIEFNRTWFTGASTYSDGVYAFQWQNLSESPVYFERFEVINGTTAGTTTAAVVTCATPNCDYVVTCPATGMAALQPLPAVDAIGKDAIPPNGMIIVKITTAPAAAKEWQGRILLKAGA